MSFDQLLTEALKLAPSDRLQLIEHIWQSIAHESGASPLTAGQNRELDRRLDRLKEQGSKGSTWDEVKRRLAKTRH